MAQKGRTGVRAEIADARRDLARQQRRRTDPPPLEERGGVKAGRWSPDRWGLPKEDECPVQPLGFEGKIFHLIDSAGQFRSLEAADFSHSGIQSLFAAAPNYVEWMCPRYGRAPKAEEGAPQPPAPIKSFEDDAVRKIIFLACTRRGLFSPVDKMRGRGAWLMRSGGILYHAGEELWLSEGAGGVMKLLECGLHEGILYPRFPAIPAPWSEKLRPQDNPAGRLLRDFQTWTWERPEVDPILLLGWLGVALVGGALKWRSAVFLIGDRETGKSTLQAMIKAILGDAIVSTAETTKAGIYQLMRNDSRAVAVDELEASTDNRKAMSVVELARVASSGGLGLRGGAEGTGSEFQVRSAFLFSAINPPPMMPQDLSRFAKLRLLPRDKSKSGEAPPEFDGDGVTGRLLLARLMSEWHRWEQAREAYRTALRDGGHSGRGQDTYGTLLAMADLMLGPELAEELGVAMVDDLSFWSEALAAGGMTEVSEALPNWQACVLHMMTNRVPAWRNGTRATIGQLLADLEDPGIPQDMRPALHEVRTQLGQAGLGIVGALVDRKWIGKLSGWGLAVPNASPLLGELFADTVWQGAPGAPGWAEALRGGAQSGAIISDKDVNRVVINGVQVRCTIIDLDKFNALMKAG